MWINLLLSDLYGKKSMLYSDCSLPRVESLSSTRIGNVKLAKAKKKVMLHDITNTGCKLFNQLPVEMKKEMSFQTFKLNVKSCLIERMAS